MPGGGYLSIELCIQISSSVTSLKAWTSYLWDDGLHQQWDLSTQWKPVVLLLWGQFHRLSEGCQNCLVRLSIRTSLIEYEKHCFHAGPQHGGPSIVGFLSPNGEWLTMEPPRAIDREEEFIYHQEGRGHVIGSEKCIDEDSCLRRLAQTHLISQNAVSSTRNEASHKRKRTDWTSWRGASWHPPPGTLVVDSHSHRRSPWRSCGGPGWVVDIWAHEHPQEGFSIYNLFPPREQILSLFKVLHGLIVTKVFI